MGGKGGGKIPGSPMLAKSGSPGGLRPAKGGVGNPVCQRNGKQVFMREYVPSLFTLRLFFHLCRLCNETPLQALSKLNARRLDGRNYCCPYSYVADVYLVW